MKDGDFCIEYDPKKRQANLIKHGVDFESAGDLLRDPELVCIELAFPDEPRTMCIGCLYGKPHLAVITQRGDCVRIISMFRFSMKMMRTLLNQYRQGKLRITEDGLAHLVKLIEEGC